MWSQEGIQEPQSHSDETISEGESRDMKDRTSAERKLSSDSLFAFRNAFRNALNKKHESLWRIAAI